MLEKDGIRSITMQMERIEIYNASLKDDVFTFTDECFRSVGKEFEPDGRHADL